MSTIVDPSQDPLVSPSQDGTHLTKWDTPALLSLNSDSVALCGFQSLQIDVSPTRPCR